MKTMAVALSIFILTFTTWSIFYTSTQDLSFSIDSVTSVIRNHRGLNYRRPSLRSDSVTTNETCNFPWVDPFDPDILHLITHKPALDCSHGNPSFTYLKEKVIYVNRSLVDRTVGLDIFLFCRYEQVFRHPSSDFDFKLGDWSPPFQFSIMPKISEKLIHVVCVDGKNTILSQALHAIIQEDSLEEMLSSVKFEKHQYHKRPKETLNVLAVGLDGVSRNHFLRAMPRTHHFLVDKLASFDMTKHNQLGLNTFPNLVPFLTGRHVVEMPWWNYSKPADAFDLIWKDFDAAGYRTLFTEDQPMIGMFHFRKFGFLKDPTHHGSRPLMLLLASAASELKEAGKDCIGDKPEVLFHQDFVERFLETYSSRPHFALTFHTRVTHDDINGASSLDHIYLRYFQRLYQKGLLNNTILLTFSDHGPRWGEARITFQGMLEGRAPFLLITLPSWFLQKYPQVAYNLKINTQKLTTHFDTYATLLDVLEFRGDDWSPPFTQHGTSLFRHLREDRTCSNSAIPPHWCLCDQLWEVTDLKTRQRVADALLREINSRREPSVCVELGIDEILLVVSNEAAVQKSNRTKHLYRVQIRTSPGVAMYEGTVTVFNGDGVLMVEEEISRLNAYGGEPMCGVYGKTREFCYCAVTE